MKCRSVTRTRWCARWPERLSPVDGRISPRLQVFDHPVRTSRDVMIYGGDARYSEIKLMVEATRPMMVLALFDTKRSCQLYIKEKFGYIAKRSDLHRGPYRIPLPKPVRVTVTVTEQRNG